MDVNQLTELVVVGANGSLHQRNIYVDDCMLPVMPLLCFAVGADEGSLVMDQLVRALRCAVEFCAVGKRSLAEGPAAWHLQPGREARSRACAAAHLPTHSAPNAGNL